MDVVADLPADAPARRNQCSRAMACSTTQRYRPRPEPWPVPRRGDDRLDAPGPDQPAVLVVVVGAVGEHLHRPLPGPAAPAADRRDRLDQGHQLGDVVPVAAGQRGGQRDAAGVGDHVVLRARPGPVPSTGLGPVLAPLLALARATRRPPPATSRSPRPPAAGPAAPHAAAATPRPRASPAAAAAPVIPDP